MSGRTHTLTGSAATGFLAQQAALHCDSMEKAEGLVSRAAPGNYRLLLLAHLKIQGFEVSKEFMEKLAAEDKKKEDEAKAIALNEHKKRLLSKPVKTARRLLLDNCKICKQPIAVGQEYHGNSKDKAHALCLRSPR